MQERREHVGTRLLIADDHPLMRVGIRALIERTVSDVEVWEAVDGRDALEVAAKVRPDIVLLDISMPNLNGVDAARQFYDYASRDYGVRLG